MIIIWRAKGHKLPLAASPWSAHLREADIAALRAKISNGPRTVIARFSG